MPWHLVPHVRLLSLLVIVGVHGEGPVVTAPVPARLVAALVASIVPPLQLLVQPWLNSQSTGTIRFALSRADAKTPIDSPIWTFSTRLLAMGSTSQSRSLLALVVRTLFLLNLIMTLSYNLSRWFQVPLVLFPALIQVATVRPLTACLTELCILTDPYRQWLWRHCGMPYRHSVYIDLLLGERNEYSHRSAGLLLFSHYTLPMNDDWE